MIEAELNKLVAEYAKKTGYDKLMKIPQFVVNGMNQSKNEKFHSFMTARITSKIKRPKLSFEINLDFDHLKSVKKTKVENKKKMKY